ncbi:unnamed protein product [Meloidogyne enterolobii]|uniref:Uncharacterized protein n=1 Tax=Meloidogyne enterolobii TaxID=390850 RepID=A0ACB0YXJ0_MELEN
MKIARYLLEKLFKCTFESAHFNFIIFNPKMIQLLFDENKINIPLQIHTRRTFLFNNNKQTKYLLKFVFNHLISNEFNVWPSNRQNLGVAFKILTTGGDKFPKVCCDDTIFKSSVYNFIIRHIETSKDCSKMVKEISLRIRRPLILSERAENIEIKNENNRVKSTKYQLSNKYNPEMKFSVYIKETFLYNDVEIKRII